MPAIKYRVTLTEEEKADLETLLRKGKSAARRQTRARILLKAAAGCRDEEVVRKPSADPLLRLIAFNLSILSRPA